MSFRRGVSLLLPLVALLTLGVARAEAPAPPPPPQEDELKRSCLDDHIEAQRQRKVGKLVRARELLLECMRPGCAALVRDDCTRWLSEVQASLATIRLSAVSTLGQPLVLTQAWLDDEPLPSPGAEPLPIDPGRHVLRAVTAQGEQASTVIEAKAGDRNIAVTLRVEPRVAALAPEKREGPIAPKRPASEGPKPLPPPPPEEPADPGAVARGWSYGIGAVGVAALGTFAVLGLLGHSKQGELEDGCAPHCTVDQVRSMDRLYAGADVALSISLTALASATVLFFTAPDAPDER